MLNHIQKRGKWYYYRRRIPTHIAYMDDRKEVKISLKTKSIQKALIRAEIYNKEIEKFWRALLESGNAANKMEKYRAAVQLAKTYGFTYKTSEEIPKSVLDEIMLRVKKTRDSAPEVEALFRRGR